MLSQFLATSSQAPPSAHNADVPAPASRKHLVGSFSNSAGVSPVLNSLVEAQLSEDTHTISGQLTEYFKYSLGRTASTIDDMGMYLAVSKSLRDRLIDRWNKAQEVAAASGAKQICYLSLEFLMGRALTNALFNLDLEEQYATALRELGFALEDIADQEVDAALGNGGLGRLAACFVDSMATLNLAACGYGLRYRYGMFKQSIENGFQVEHPDYWLRHGAPWEIERFDIEYPVRFYGHTTARLSPETGEHVFGWEGGQCVKAVAYDTLVPGFNTSNVINLRLWQAAPGQEFQLNMHNAGNYYASVSEKLESENITAVLYPNDNSREGRILRLKQEHFFVSATLQDVIARAKALGVSLDRLGDRFCLQLNDTHPALSVAELMRLLLDEHSFGWEDAWAVVTSVFAYTNHTVLPEALEKWPEHLVGELLPRHLDIIREINRRWCAAVEARWPADHARVHRMAIIADGTVHMAVLAIVGSFAVNGVAAIHSEIIRTGIFADFAEFWPSKFQNKTNGVTPRRWIAESNPELADLITERLVSKGVIKDAHGWPAHLEHLRHLAEDVNDGDLLRRLAEIKRNNKVRLAEIIKADCGVEVSPDALFDIQVKRIHEYKRQLLNILSVVARFQELNAMDDATLAQVQPRVVIFGGKAASGYERAKQIIKLISAVAETINADARISPFLKVVFIPNYCVSIAEKIIPAADLNEQVSTAGTEASGTGNMKFVMNGAPIIGTLDGANVEIREDVGDENMFIFGATADQVEGIRETIRNGTYVINPQLRAAIDAVSSGMFGAGEFLRPLVESILHHDFYILSADFASYHATRWGAVDAVYRDTQRWQQMCLLNIALSNRFSSDRTIRDYARDIWSVRPLKLPRRFAGTTLRIGTE